jgi:hypothetical protein
MEGAGMIERSAATRRSRLLRAAAIAGAGALACFGLTAVSAASTAKPVHAPAGVDQAEQGR